MMSLANPVVLSRSLLRRMLCCRTADTWSADWGSVAFLGTDDRIHAVHLGEIIDVLPVDEDLRAVLRSVQGAGPYTVAA